MPQRIRWYLAEPLTRKGLDALLGAFTRDEYRDGKQWGFSGVAHRGSKIDGQYIERFERVLTVEDPFGKVLEFPRVDFDKWIFSIGVRIPNIEVQDAPRSSSTFLNQIAQYLNFEIAITAIQLDPLAWVERIEDNVSALEVCAVSIADVCLTNSVQAKIALAGGADVRPQIKTLTGRRCYSVRRLQVKGVHRTQAFKCDLFSDGRAIISSAGTEIAPLLRDCLASAVGRVGSHDH